MKIKIIGAKFDSKKMHVYDVKTTGKHPVHMIESGEYITEDMTEYDSTSDMGVFGLNAKDYKWFKEHLVEIEVEVK